MSEKIKRRFATFGEQYRITKLIDEYTTVIHKDTDGTEIREFSNGWSMEKIAQSVNPELHKRHVQHVADQLKMKFKQPPTNGEVEDDLKRRVEALEDQMAELQRFADSFK